ncbi:hypothetical protein [Desulfovibrio inopinatus]
MFSSLGARPIQDLNAPELLSAIRFIEARGDGMDGEIPTLESLTFLECL